jgi:uncharacterized membrane protein
MTGQQRAGAWSWTKAIGYVVFGVALAAVLLYVIGADVTTYVGVTAAYLIALYRAHRVQREYLARSGARGS